MSEAEPKPRGIEGQKRGNLDLSTTRKRHVEKEKKKKKKGGAGAAAKELPATARRHPRQHGCEYRSEE